MYSTDNLPASSVTTWISELAANASIEDLSDTVIYRSQRMMLDTFGVGILGAKTDISHTVQQCAHTWGTMHGHVGTTSCTSTLWGSKGRTAPLAMAAFINGVNIHSMDFDDTWFPATHPSGPVLPAIIALAETMTGDYEPSTEDILVAYNVGIEVQGLLLRCSQMAKSIPDRFHPPAVVGVMGSAAASARLLGFSPLKTRHALAIAASFAGAPMANAGTTTKPLHTGKAARFGLEAALLADHGLEGNHDILDMDSGFGAFYDDYDPIQFLADHVENTDFVLHNQDIAFKRFPAHLGMHWAIDATMDARNKICSPGRRLETQDVKSIHILTPKSRYINRPLPTSEHEARHSFQFNVCTALLDGEVVPASYTHSHRRRPYLNKLLSCTTLEAPADNVASFQDMYVEVHVTMKDGTVVSARCDSPYGHWRNPLTDNDLQAKFLTNTKDMLYEPQKFLMESVTSMTEKKSASDFLKTLHF
ncbi:cis-aconitate decarboxylase-like isoform X2 [Gigantopelta aegis]|uniref:cis-aconitate decarboxylase-like isoform X2 n=1 Tax=Gigantopelta aegis TaxID=1735272 RepID=UPI001B8884CA|nr:cis-aconitate decarboxylase-like isoform X2 [Gigantopelta aegis]